MSRACGLVRTFTLAFAAGTLLLPLELAAQREPGSSENADIQRAVERIREVTQPFHDIEAAQAAGYPSVDQCLESATGGMGYHFMNRDLFDDRLEVERPEILVYAPDGKGERTLAGVEYVVPYSAWNQEEPPRILGQDLKRSNGLQIWYLHVWTWKENPDGLFADWHPEISCPS